jgi:tetratricopeptide (TPR) repeat protein
MKWQTLSTIAVIILLLISGCAQKPTVPEITPTATVATSTKSPTPGLVSEQDRKAAQEMMEDARKFTWDKKYEEALYKLNKAKEKNPKDPDIYRAIAEVYRNTNDYSKAVEVFDEALKIDPENKDLLMAKGSALQGRNNHAEAVEIYKKVIQMDPKDMNPYFEIAYCHRVMNEFDKAEIEYQKAVDKFPKSYKPLEKFAEYYYSRAFSTYNDRMLADELWQKCIDKYKETLNNISKNDKLLRPGITYHLAEARYYKWESSRDKADKDSAIKAFLAYKKFYPRHIYSKFANQKIKELKKKI